MKQFLSMCGYVHVLRVLRGCVYRVCVSVHCTHECMCIRACVCRNRCVYVYMSVQVLTVHVEMRGGPLVSCSVTVPFSLEAGLSLNLELAFWVCGQPVSLRIFLLLHSAFMWMFGMQIQFLACIGCTLSC